MNDTKKIGRPRAFDEREALLAAVAVFWRKGYDGTSMKDLTEAMGINGPSLYAAFGNKEALYLKAIEAYATNDACAPLLAFDSESDIRKAVAAFFKAAISYSTEGAAGATGCFLSSCVATTAGEVPGVQEMLRDAVLNTDKRLATRFEFERKAGNLPPDFPSDERARLMLDLRQGLVLRARAGVGAESLLVDVDQRSELILAKR